MREEKRELASATSHVEDLVRDICLICDFYKPREQRLECGAYKILKYLVTLGKLSEEDLVLASQACRKDTSEEI